MEVSNVAATISLTAVNFEKLMSFQLSVTNIFRFSQVSLLVVFFGIFNNIIENVPTLFFPNRTCVKYFVHKNPVS